MSYSDDAVKAKLNSLNETQDSIVTVAQWIMFHRRHADRTASLWLGRLQESNMSKKLNLIYLANEVVQQSRARSKTDFLVAFEPLIADATATAYKGATQEVQGKLRRVVEVWRQRSIFDPCIQEQIEKRIDEVDKQKGGKSLGGGGKLGGSLFGGSGGGVAPELDALNKAQIAVIKAEAATKTPINTANAQYAKLTDPNVPVPSPPVRAAKLGQLVKKLRAASGAVDASIKSRRELLAGLEKLLESNRAKLATEEATSADLHGKVEDISDTVREVEDSIMRGQDVPASNGPSEGGDWNAQDPERPETEGFTPPPPDVESFTPPPQQEHLGATSDPMAATLPGDEGQASTTGAEPIQEEPVNFNEPPPSFVPPSALQDTSAAAQTEELLRTLMSAGQVRQASGEILSTSAGANPGDPRLKRRKMSHQASNDVDDEIFGAGNVGGVDEAGISAMLSQ